MNPANPSDSHRYESGQVVANFYVQDLSYITALQEIFASNGTAVNINKNIREIPNYLICAGDPDFVKAFYETQKTFPVRTLFIIYGGTPADPNVFTQHGIKIYLADTKPLSAVASRDICVFLFTSSTKI